MDMQASLRPVNGPAIQIIFHIAACLTLLYLFLLTPIALAQSCTGDEVASLPCESVADPGVARSTGSGFRHVGNPIDVISGSKQQHEVDYQAVGSPLHFSRYYHSAQSDSNASLGQGWRHSYLVRLYAVDGEHRRVQQADGRWIDFTLVDAADTDTGTDTDTDTDTDTGTGTGAGTGTGTDKKLFLATYEDDGYLVDDGAVVWKLPDGRVLRFQGSFLVRIDYPHGINLHLFYKDRKLASVSDKHGRELRLEYLARRAGLPDYQQTLRGEHRGHLKAVHLPSGQSIKYLYDSNQNMVQVSYPDKTNTDYQFLNPTYPNHLSSKTSTTNTGLGKRTWTYDSAGRVVQFEHPAKNKSMSLAYELDATIAGHGVTVVAYAHGRKEQYRWKGGFDSGDAFVVDVGVRDCFDCQLTHFQPVLRGAQVPSQVIEHELQPSDKDNRIGLRTNAGVDGSSFGKLPQFDQLDQSPVSFDQRTRVMLDGADYSILLKVSRVGDVDDISVGSTSLSELKNKWAEGNIERCDAQPRLQRSQIYPSPKKGCLEDLIYLVELARHVERISQKHGLKNAQPAERRGSASTAPAACMQNPFQSCKELERNFQLAQLSGCAYYDAIQLCGEHWQAVAPSSLGLDDVLFNDGSFSATLFHNPISGEYVLAFRGSDNLGDWKDNFIQAGGGATQQYQNAVELAKALDQVLPPDALAFTGHSLGGGLATAAALSVHAPASVFNPAALHPDTAVSLGLDYADAQSLVDVTTVDGDLLTSIQESAQHQPITDESPVAGRFPAPGSHTVIAAPSDDWIEEERQYYPFLARSDGVVLHSIGAVVETENNLLVELCGKTPSRA